MQREGDLYIFGGSSDDESSLNSEGKFEAIIEGIKENDICTERLEEHGGRHYIQNMSNEEWEELGRDISNNTRFLEVHFYDDALDDQKMSFFFQGLTGSSSVKEMLLYRNELSVAGLRCMVPFLQNANNLKYLNVCENNLHRSEGFNVLFSALRNSPIEKMDCSSCGIDFIEINSEHMPKRLKELYLNENVIDADGCRELAKLLQGENATLELLHLRDNAINDEGVSILVNPLQNNTKLTTLGLRNNNISKRGQIMLLNLVNDIFSIEATLQSNHTLTELYVKRFGTYGHGVDPMQEHINEATEINIRHKGNPEAAGREKVIQTQLRSANRAKLAELQGVTRSVYSNINPLHLPEVFALIGRHHDQRDLYVALTSSIAALISTVDVKEFLQQQRAYHRAKLDAIEEKIAAMEAAEGLAEKRRDSSSGGNKRRRV